MRQGAIIVAAGMSSRMGAFKPMLNMGAISVAQRIVANFKQAGIETIVMVTGYNATMLERHLSGHGVIFLRNTEYETTQMFDSAKIGLTYLQDKCDQILFTPVDIPLFTSATVQKLLESGAPLACPVCQGKTGHPILLTRDVVTTILKDHGEDGLKGALARSGTFMTEVAVEDPGTLFDADTPEEYAALLAYHNSQLARPELHVALVKEKPFFDEKMAMLLTQVDECGSVRAACQRMQISYSTGWNMIRTLETQLCYAVVLRSQGGVGGSTSQLTKEGHDLLERFRKFQAELKEHAYALYDKYFTGAI